MLSKDLSESTHPLAPTKSDPSPTEPIALAVNDGFRSPKSEINGSEIGSPPLKPEKTDPTDPSFFWRKGVDSTSFEIFFGRFKLDSARFC